MKLMVLLFPSADKLIRFRMAADPKIYEADLKNRTLFCFLNEEQAELADYVYGAKVLQMQASSN